MWFEIGLLLYFAVLIFLTYKAAEGLYGLYQLNRSKSAEEEIEYWKEMYAEGHIDEDLLEYSIEEAYEWENGPPSYLRDSSEREREPEKER